MIEEIVQQDSFNMPAIRTSLPKGYSLQLIDGEVYRWVNYTSAGEFTKRKDLAILTAWVDAVREAGNAKG
jgi:hypothetical protein